jgi:porin
MPMSTERNSRRRRNFSRIALCALLGWPCAGALAAESTPDDAAPAFGGPDAVENMLLEERIQAWKSRLMTEHGLGIGLDYSTTYLRATKSLDDKEAWGGMARFFGSWELANRGGKNSGALVWKVEHRHGISDVPPVGLAGQLGYAGLVAPPFSDQEFRFTNLYWRQRLNEGRSTLIAGFLDATDYVDVYALASPWTGFSNFAFSTGTQTIPVPNDATLGVAFGTMLSKRAFLIAGLTDTNADPTDLGETVDSFFDDNEYFTSVELGLTSSQERIYLDNLHVTFWHVDRREVAGTPSGWGLNFSWSTWLGERWMPFVRAGYADEGGSLLELALSAGAGYRTRGGNVLGFAGHWGKPNEDTYQTDLKDQYVGEVYFRWKIGKHLEITPNLQLLVDPALNPQEDAIWIFGLRAKGAL